MKEIENQIKVLSIEDEQYPIELKNIYDPPAKLYAIGNIEELKNKAIAIVGSRKISEYGKKASKYFAYNLAKRGCNIVSGLARGVDSYAHIGNILALMKEGNISGKPIAVLGNGLDIIYPSENKRLYENIIKYGGVIISEYPLGTKPEKMNFPARNRIISALSKAVLVVEARAKSGALITADFALEQGKDVFAVPGNINLINSVGTNNLIKDGAILVTNANEIEI